MPDEAPLPRKVTIRPAGWVVIVLALVGTGWLVWHFAAPHVMPLLQGPSGGPDAASGAVVETDGDAEANASVDVGTDTAQIDAAETRDVESNDVEAGVHEADDATADEPSSTAIDKPSSGRPAWGQDELPATAPRLPAPSPVIARLAWPVQAGVIAPRPGIWPAASEREALRMVAQGHADYAVASTAALASVPDVIEAGARVVWSLGPAPDTARLFPSCDPDALRQMTLGAEAGSAGHLELLAAFAGSDLPPITLFDRYDELEKAIAQGTITGGPRLNEGAPCHALPVAVTTLLVVRGPEVEVDAGQVAAIASLSSSTSSPEDVAAFFDEARTAPGGFFEVFQKTQRLWKRVALVTKETSAFEAVDRLLLWTERSDAEKFAVEARETTKEENEAEVEEPVVEAVDEKEGQAPRRNFGRPSWPERR